MTGFPNVGKDFAESCAFRCPLDGPTEYIDQIGGNKVALNNQLNISLTPTPGGT